MIYIISRVLSLLKNEIKQTSFTYGRVQVCIKLIYLSFMLNLISKLNARLFLKKKKKKLNARLFLASTNLEQPCLEFSWLSSRSPLTSWPWLSILVGWKFIYRVHLDKYGLYLNYDRKLCIFLFNCSFSTTFVGKHTNY